MDLSLLHHQLVIGFTATVRVIRFFVSARRAFLDLLCVSSARYWIYRAGPARVVGFFVPGRRAFGFTVSALPTIDGLTTKFCTREVLTKSVVLPSLQ